MEKWRQGCGEDDCNDDAWENANGVYSNANRLAQVANVTLTMQCLVGRQTCRNNTIASTPSEYYKRAIRYPFLDCTL